MSISVNCNVLYTTTILKHTINKSKWNLNEYSNNPPVVKKNKYNKQKGSNKIADFKSCIYKLKDY